MTVNCKSRRPLVEDIGCTCPCSTTPPVHSERKRKQVTFSGHFRGVYILHIDDYTDEELFSTWYGPEDRKQIAEDIRQTLAKMESGKELAQQEDDEHFCRRGLESRTENGASTKKHVRLAAINAVLDEQEAQDCQGVSNEQLISEVYMGVTLFSKLAAARRGFDDLQEVMSDQTSYFISKKAVDCSSIFQIGSPSPQLRKMSYCLQNAESRLRHLPRSYYAY
jgi:hypothetical protein